MTTTFSSTTRVAAPITAVFELALSIDAHEESMNRSRERAIGGVTSGQIGLGEEVTWRVWHFGVPWTMTTLVTELDRPHRFVDEQVRGPFAAFRHEHRFREGSGATEMNDIVDFTAPYGRLGRLVEDWILARRVRRLIDARNAFLRRAAESWH